VLEDRRQPRSAVRAGLESVKRLKRLHHRFLHEILGFGAVSLEPHCQPKQAIDVRQSFRLKGGPYVVVDGWRWRPCHYSQVTRKCLSS